jgi:3-phenylpropionate/trans-cinnamate dioxygenase ferredoxin subunit
VTDSTDSGNGETEARPRGQRHVVGRVEEIPPGARRIVRIDGRAIGVLNVDGRYYAIRNVCPHHGAPLCEGRIEGTMLPSAPHEYVFGMRNRILRCPWHGFEFDLETGRSLFDPEGMRVKVYPVTVETGQVTITV